MCHLFKTFLVLLLTALCLGCCTTSLNKSSIEDAPQSSVIQDPDVGHDEWKDCGGEIGNHACNFEFLDQHANTWELYDHYGKIIILDFSTMWCSVCQYVALKADSIQALYHDKDVIWVTVLVQDTYGLAVPVEGAQAWAKIYGIETTTVLAANDSVAAPGNRGSFEIKALPTIIIIDEDMVITYRVNGWNETRVRTQLDAMLNPESD